jgi:site-specific DNA-methyltransferase (adenine-specific)
MLKQMQLLHGDCLELMKTLPDKSVDLFICDLPYGCLGPVKKGGGVPRENTDGAFGGCEWDIPIDLDAFWIQVERLMKNEHTPIIQFCNTRFGYELIKSKEKWFRYDLVWSKPLAVGFLLANKMPLRSHENIYVFSKKGANYNRVDIEGDFPNTNKGSRPTDLNNNVFQHFENTPKISNEGKRCIKSVIEIHNKKAKGQHPTAKPVELYKFLIERYSNEGDTILDPTFGSGNSGLASTELKRKYIGIEKDEKFFNAFVEKQI